VIARQILPHFPLVCGQLSGAGQNLIQGQGVHKINLFFSFTLPQATGLCQTLCGAAHKHGITDGRVDGWYRDYCGKRQFAAPIQTVFFRGFRG
jgi:hypothetical protein